MTSYLSYRIKKFKVPFSTPLLPSVNHTSKAAFDRHSLGWAESHLTGSIMHWLNEIPQLRSETQPGQFKLRQMRFHVATIFTELIWLIIILVIFEYFP
jgi:hypothetical protein